MLEEALNNANGSPAETSRALLSFFRQEFPLGGTAAEARFVHFFPLLLERIFGPVLAKEATAEQLKAMEAAWLMYSRPWRTTSTSSTTGTGSSTPPPTPYSPSMSPYSTSQSSLPKLEADPVVQLLSTPHPQQRIPMTSGSDSQSEGMQEAPPRALSFFQILGCQSDLELHILRNAQSSFPFTELPRNAQRALIHVIQQGAGAGAGSVPSGQGNAQKLLDCLSINPLKQKEFVNVMRQTLSRLSFGQGTNVASPNGHLHSPMHSHSHSPMHMNMSPQFSSSSPLKIAPSQNIRVLEQSVKLNLSLWEYYFVVFVRFPLIMGQMSDTSKKSSSTATSAYGYRPPRQSSPYGERVYYHLLKDYMKWYFPHIFDKSPRASVSDGFDNKNDEILIRFMMEYWFERHVYTSTKDAIGNLASGDDGNLLALDSSYDLAQLFAIGDKWSSGLGSGTRQRYDAPPKQVQRSIKFLVEHLICDPSIARTCRVTGNRGKEASNGNEGGWPLPAIQTIAQPSLYNYIRTALRYGPIHVTNSSFYAAMDLWLLWLEPWNVVQRKLPLLLFAV